MRRSKGVTERDRYRVLKALLDDRRREVQDKLRSLRESLPAEALVRDAEEQSVDDFVQDIDVALMEMKSETLRKIDEAVARLEDGRYGRCAECGTEIAEARLRALPFAVLCRPCQEEVESHHHHDREYRGAERVFQELSPLR